MNSEVRLVAILGLAVCRGPLPQPVWSKEFSRARAVNSRLVRALPTNSSAPVASRTHNCRVVRASSGSVRLGIRIDAGSMLIQWGSRYLLPSKYRLLRVYDPPFKVVYLFTGYVRRLLRVQSKYSDRSESGCALRSDGKRDRAETRLAVILGHFCLKPQLRLENRSTRKPFRVGTTGEDITALSLLYINRHLHQKMNHPPPNVLS
uniref:Secreted protein n=1 Tax=Steinernema glaseri TaxID=37863 RepID=A0A1I8A5A8_9BILA